ncbi:MAG: MMPL family transporter [Deltaproteobacteria bacterium]|nr:MMPL family transporter [Deltaproteobacteria bacterium]
MIARFSSFLVKPAVAWAVASIVLLGSGVGVVLAMQVEHEDDILSFLPQGDPDVKTFHRLGEAFGGLNIALVGLETTEVFRPDFLRRLKQLTERLEGHKGLDRVLSLTNLVDFTPDKSRGGIVAAPLIGEVPTDPAQLAALKQQTLARTYVVNNLVAADSKAVLIYCFLSHGSDPRSTAAGVKRVVAEFFDAKSSYFGGGPFIAAYIYNSTQEDMQRLTPWAVAAIVLVMMIAFRDLRGTVLALLSTSFGIVFSLGTMSVLGIKVNLALGSMPVILFAVGSAYGIHVLARYYSYARTHSGPDAIRMTLQSTGPTVLAAGMTTVVSLLSFVTMDLAPLRVFGVFTALGIFATLVLSLTFIPSVALLLKLGDKRRNRSGPSLGERCLQALAQAAQRHRLLTGSVIGALSAVALVLVFRVDSRIELSALFNRDSPPDRAEHFMQRRFGGSHFLALELSGEITQPETLREIQYLADYLIDQPEVAQVLHIGVALRRANEAMEGLPRLPDRADKVKNLLALVSSDRSLDQLLNKNRRQALMHVKLLVNDADRQEAFLSRLERWLAARIGQGYRRVGSSPEHAAELSLVREQRFVAQVQATLKETGQPLSASQVTELRAAYRASAKIAADPKQVAASIARYLASEENVVDLKSLSADADQLATALAALGPAAGDDALSAVLKRQISDAEAREDLLLALQSPLYESWTGLRAKRRALLIASRLKLAASNARYIVPALLDARASSFLVAARPGAANALRPLRHALSGLPVLHRALARSALNNQVLSLSVALVPVIVIMALLFRSLRTGLMVAAPTLFTLLVIYGGMGLAGVHLDIGTAMLACIILGAGVDYAVHLVAEWRAPDDADPAEGAVLAAAARRAVSRSGVAIATNALAVALGFGILTTGEARPLQNVGGLTAVAMLVAALGTFFIVPLFARRHHYRRGFVAQSAELEESVNQASAVDVSTASGGRQR